MLLSLFKVALLTCFSGLSFFKTDSSLVHNDLSVNEEVDFHKADKRYLGNPYTYDNNQIINKTFRKQVDIDLSTFTSSDIFVLDEEFMAYRNPWSMSYYNRYEGIKVVEGGNTWNINFNANGDWILVAQWNKLTDEFVTEEIFDYSDVLIFENNILDLEFSYGTIDGFAFLYDINNARVHVNANSSFGGIIGSTNFLNKYNGEQTLNYNLGTYIINFNLGSSIGGYCAINGLFYVPRYDEFYTELGFNLLYLASGTEVQTENGVQKLPYDCIMVATLFLANGLSDSYQSTINDYRFICINDYALYDNTLMPTNHMTMYLSEFVCIGQYMTDVNYWNNLLNDQYDIFAFFEDLNVENLNKAVVVNDGDDINKPTNLLGSTLDLMALGISKLFGFLDTEIYPGISIGIFVFIPFSVTLLIFILKLFKR